jgi:type IV pilus assembly protein PilB
VEFSLDGVGQVNIREDIGLSFSATLRSFLRQDPDVIMVGEIRDKETGNIAIKAALTGHLVLSTLHTNDAVSTVMRLVNMGIEPYLITEAVSLVVAQRLARKICKNCKVEDKSVTHAELKSIGLTDKIKLYKGKGCSECGQTGSKGRKGIYEVLGLDADFIKGVLGKESKSNADLLKIAKGSGFKTMRDKGKKMVTLGEISLKELNRILAPESE